MHEAHFILYVRDQAESAGYYGRVLQLQPILDVPGMTEFRLLDGSILGIMPVAGAMGLLGPATFSGPTNAPKAELYLVVDDAQGHHQRALEQGATELSPMLERDWGHRAAYSVDHDGHVLAFAEKLGSGDEG